MTNTRVLFNQVPDGMPTLSTFKVESDQTPPPSELPANSLLIKLLWISLDPYMRGRMRESSKESYVDAFTLGKPFNGGAVALVEVCVPINYQKSTSTKFKQGDVVMGFFPWCTWSVVPEAVVGRVVTDSPDWIGKLGMPSLTAYYGLLKIGKPKKGETLFVSAASGAVGQMVGQIGKKLGLRVVGSAGSDDKVQHLKAIGFDYAFNYKTQDTDSELAKGCPAGIDIYFENVGGSTLEIVLTRMNTYGRIPACGMISQYNEQSGVKNLMNIIGKRLTIQGFIIGDHTKEISEEFFAWMGEHGKDLQYETTIANGLESIPEAFIGMMNGKNIGKQLVKV